MNALAIGLPVTTFTGRTGRIVALVQLTYPEAARVVVALPLRVDGAPPVLIHCRYHPTDVRVEEVDDAR